MSNNYLPTPLKPFITDGCSGLFSAFWIRLFQKPFPCESCCVKHDWAYYHGGEDFLKENADEEFKNCVKECLRKELEQRNRLQEYGAVLAELMKLAVSKGGAWYIPYSNARWGFGYGYLEYAKLHLSKSLKGLVTPEFPEERFIIRDEITNKFRKVDL